jgi:hypothetical protein
MKKEGEKKTKKPRPLPHGVHELVPVQPQIAVNQDVAGAVQDPVAVSTLLMPAH